jgi:hypothetical protein
VDTKAVVNQLNYYVVTAVNSEGSSALSMQVEQKLEERKKEKKKKEQKSKKIKRKRREENLKCLNRCKWWQ